jgi:hypothetical protein
MVEITEANAREAGQAAERLLADRFLAETLDEIIMINTEQAIVHKDRDMRREARHLVLAVQSLRTQLRAVFEHWRDAAKIYQSARARE